MNIVFYDLALLVVFALFAIVFLYRRRKNLKRQGIFYLYKTQFGIKFIDKFVKKTHKFLRPLQYLVIACGYALMAAITWLMIKTTWIYLTTSISQVFRAPPVAPLIPYFPKLFGLESYFPPLYFTYFIIALAIVAITHEFSHGIFARLNNFKILSTGFAFLGPVLGAFVEPDEKQMAKAKKFPQLSVLAAGTFANVVMFAIFGIVMMIFFAAFFVPAGVKFNSYAVAQLDINEVKVLGSSDIVEGFLEIESNGKKYYYNEQLFEQAQQRDEKYIVAYEDYPAFREQIRGAIVSINGKKVKSLEELQQAIAEFKPGDRTTVRTATLVPGQEIVDEYKDYEIDFGNKDGNAFLGVGFVDARSAGFVGYFYELTMGQVKDALIFYESTIGNFGWFIYYLLWWIVMINILVALFNMLPLGALDGGRFFYLTVWGITRNEKIGRVAYKFMLWFFLAMLVVLMSKWVIGFF